MVLKNFEKYIVIYVLAGSLVQGKATSTSDIDVFVVIDDTDVKKMTRYELKEKLRGIIVSMGFEAGQYTGITNKLNIQTYILTEFWENIREANPVIFTFLRDGVPFHDRGIFMAWKQLLKMGKIRPSPESIDQYMSIGDQSLDRIKARLRDIASEDFFYSILTPSQAAIMLYGMAPPTPKETPGVLRELFVHKEKIMPDSDVQILERVIKIRKDIEHGTKKEVTGQEIDELLRDCDHYLKQLKELFGKIETTKDKEFIQVAYEQTMTLLRDALRLEGIEQASTQELVTLTQRHLIDKGKLHARFIRQLDAVLKAKKEFDAGKLTATEFSTVRKNAGDIARDLLEYIQRTRSADLDKARIRVRVGDRLGDMYVFGRTVVILKDIDAAQKEFLKSTLQENGGLGEVQPCAIEEFEHTLAKGQAPHPVRVTQALFESVRKVFGPTAEIILHG